MLYSIPNEVAVSNSVTHPYNSRIVEQPNRTPRSSDQPQRSQKVANKTAADRS
jgi:hypothetical protein